MFKHCSIKELAQVIDATWGNVYFGARPYLDAMHELENIDDNYYLDSGKSVVLYFLANAQTWRGQTAREVKAELKRRCK